MRVRASLLGELQIVARCTAARTILFDLGAALLTAASAAVADSASLQVDVGVCSPNCRCSLHRVQHLYGAAGTKSVHKQRCCFTSHAPHPQQLGQTPQLELITTATHGAAIKGAPAPPPLFATSDPHALRSSVSMLGVAHALFHGAAPLCVRARLEASVLAVVRAQLTAAAVAAVPVPPMDRATPILNDSWCRETTMGIVGVGTYVGRGGGRDRSGVERAHMGGRHSRARACVRHSKAESKTLDSSQKRFSTCRHNNQNSFSLLHTHTETHHSSLPPGKQHVAKGPTLAKQQQQPKRARCSQRRSAARRRFGSGGTAPRRARGSCPCISGRRVDVSTPRRTPSGPGSGSGKARVWRQQQQEQ